MRDFICGGKNRPLVLRHRVLTLISQISLFMILDGVICNKTTVITHHNYIQLSPQMHPILPLPLGLHTDVLSESGTKLLVSIDLISTGRPDPRTANL